MKDFWPRLEMTKIENDRGVKKRGDCFAGAGNNVFVHSRLMHSGLTADRVQVLKKLW
jgi:hypothetical protein